MSPETLINRCPKCGSHGTLDVSDYDMQDGSDYVRAWEDSLILHCVNPDCDFAETRVVDATERGPLFTPPPPLPFEGWTDADFEYYGAMADAEIDDSDMDDYLDYQRRIINSNPDTADVLKRMDDYLA